MQQFWIWSKVSQRPQLITCATTEEARQQWDMYNASGRYRMISKRP
jgi:hypothetical protein